MYSRLFRFDLFCFDLNWIDHLKYSRHLLLWSSYYSLIFFFIVYLSLSSIQSRFNCSFNLKIRTEHLSTWIQNDVMSTWASSIYCPGLTYSHHKCKWLISNCWLLISSDLCFFIFIFITYKKMHFVHCRYRTLQIFLLSIQ